MKTPLAILSACFLALSAVSAAAYSPVPATILVADGTRYDADLSGVRLESGLLPLKDGLQPRGVVLFSSYPRDAGVGSRLDALSRWDAAAILKFADLENQIDCTAALVSAIKARQVYSGRKLERINAANLKMAVDAASRTANLSIADRGRLEQAAKIFMARFPVATQAPAAAQAPVGVSIIGHDI